MGRRWCALATLLVMVVGMLAAPLLVFGNGYVAEVIAPGPPPAPQYEAPAGPRQGYVWAGGHWHWAGRWIWAPGGYIPAPYPRAVWVPGRWVHRAYGWVWIEGQFYGGGLAGPGYVAGGSPPSPQVEVVGVAPFAGAVWIGGYYRWSGAGWVWVRGYWGRPPWPRAHWIGGRWTRQGGGWVWVGGYWR